jgi:hypothetical protein
MKIVRDGLFNRLKNDIFALQQEIENNLRNMFSKAGKTEEEINNEINSIKSKIDQTTAKWTDVFIDMVIGRIKKGDAYYDLIDSVNTKVVVDNDTNIKITVYPSIKTVQENTNITLNDEIILVNTTTAVTLTLPDVTTAQSKLFVIKNINTGTVTIQPSGTVTIDDSPNFILNTKNQSVTIVSDKNNWYIIGYYLGGI